MERKVRVRFAPSPTGALHLGGVRTALFNYMFARRHGGDFILRIEDTDQTRYVEGAEEYIIESLKWCGLTFDEGVGFGGEYGPYRQSERKALYKDYAMQLIENGNAYYSFDTAEELDAYRSACEQRGETFIYNAKSRTSLKNSLSMSADEVAALLNAGTPYVIRFKMPDNEELHLTDIIRGEVQFNTSLLDDKVLYKSDGMPTYHLANIVDDHLMKITHVIRGEEWLPSMPLHVLLYRAFGWQDTMPQFAHLPLILKPIGNGKLSKRDGNKMGFPVFPMQFTDPQTGEVWHGYKEDGYFPDAFINMLALLGWNPGNDQEIMTIEEMTALFSLERVGKSGSKFDPEKTRWFNHKYLNMRSDAEIATLLKEVVAKEGVNCSDETLVKISSLLKERATFVKDIYNDGMFFFHAPSTFDEKGIKKCWKDETPDLMRRVYDVIEGIADFSADNIHNILAGWITEQGIGFGKVMMPLRLAMVGEMKGPDMHEIVAVLGKEEALRRLDYALKTIA
ncbi:MAG: glutamate--tRNA ligase [Marinifilaceae bacterium]